MKKLKTNFLGRNIIYYKEIDSTQCEIWRLIKNRNILNGTLVISEIQTKGKGTHGRIWHTDEKGDIAFSFFVQMDCNITKLEGITIEIAKIINEIIEEQYNIKLEIKEPNDIVYRNKKIGGILTETKIISENVKYLVVGIGINTRKQNFSKDIENVATSIRKEFNIDIDTEEFISEFCNKFECMIIQRQSN
ncbi:MAG: biotin--[acetyl-CoA-carboxylase] ligase [Clostridia bacterium]|nr:biotin--[acetyl-CoA-carboxylase] ligase [Clostridia bacterium]